MKLDFSVEARLDLFAAQDYYESERAGLGQADRAVLLVVDQALLGKLADRLRRGAGRNPDPVGQHLGADLFHRPLLGVPDDFQVVLANRGETASLVVSPHNDKV